MRKITFTIDEREAFRREHDFTEEQAQSIFGDSPGFQARYTLLSQKEDLQIIDRYELTDFDGNRIDLNTLNPFQRGVFLEDCKRYFEGRNLIGNSDKPMGVIDIVEEDVA